MFMEDLPKFGKKVRCFFRECNSFTESIPIEGTFQVIEKKNYHPVLKGFKKKCVDCHRTVIEYAQLGIKGERYGKRGEILA